LKIIASMANYVQWVMLRRVAPVSAL